MCGKGRRSISKYPAWRASSILCALFLLFPVFFGTADSALAENGNTAPAELWSVTYDGGSTDWMSGAAVDAAGNVYWTGYILSNPGNIDYATVKYDSDGNLSWVRYFDEDIAYGGYMLDAMELAQDVAVDSSGNAVVTGYRYKVGASECVTVKYSPGGGVLWLKKYDIGSYNFCNKIAADGLGNVYITVESPANPWRILEYDASGNTVAGITAAGDNSLSSIIDFTADPQGNIYVLGGKTGDSRTVLMVKFDVSKRVAWSKTYAAGARCYPGVSAQSDGVYVSSLPCGASDPQTVTTTRYDGAGNETWTRSYSGGAIAPSSSTSVLTSGSDGSAYVNAIFSGGNAAQTVTLKYDLSGNLVWTKQHQAGFVPQQSGLDGAGHPYLLALAFNGANYDVQIKKIDRNPSPALPPPVPPSVTINSPAQGSYVSTRTVLVAGTIGDAAAVSVTVNGLPAVIAGNSFSIDNVPLAEGGNTITVVATAATGQSGSSSVTVVSDTIAPPVPLLDTVSSLTNLPSVTLSGYAESDGTVEINGVAAATATADGSGRFSATVYLASNVSNSFVCTVRDKAGNLSEAATFSVIQDSTAPSVTGVSIMADPRDTLAIPVRIGFSEEPSAATLNGNITVTGPSGVVAGSFSLSGTDVIFTPLSDLRPNETHTVSVGTGVADRAGNRLAAVYSSLFETRVGSAFVTGEVYDDTLGLPLAGAEVMVLKIDGAAPALPIASATDAEGRYSFRYDGGIGTALIEIRKNGFTRVFRRAALVPNRSHEVFDARLTPLAVAAAVNAGEAGLTGKNTVFHIPAGAPGRNATVSVTVLSRQGFAHRLPPGWSPV